MTAAAAFRTCICPICGISVHQDQISRHVELHFASPAASSDQQHHQHLGFNNIQSGGHRGNSFFTKKKQNFLPDLDTRKISHPNGKKL